MTEEQIRAAERERVAKRFEDSGWTGPAAIIRAMLTSPAPPEPLRHFLDAGIEDAWTEKINALVDRVNAQGEAIRRLAEGVVK